MITTILMFGLAIALFACLYHLDITKKQLESETERRSELQKKYNESVYHLILEKLNKEIDSMTVSYGCSLETGVYWNDVDLHGDDIHLYQNKFKNIEAYSTTLRTKNNGKWSYLKGFFLNEEQVKSIQYCVKVKDQGKEDRGSCCTFNVDDSINKNK